MSDTPRTDRVLKNCNGWHHVPIELARELERELNEANDRIKRLEEAGNELIWAFCPASVSMMTERESDALKLWLKAKEVKL